MIVGSIMLMLMFRNIMVKDYNTETSSYLKSVGHEDSVDKIIPKTMAQLTAEKKARETLLTDLAANYTALLGEVHHLRSDVNLLIQASAGAGAAKKLLTTDATE